MKQIAKQNINKYRSLFFSFGLVLVLILTISAFRLDFVPRWQGGCGGFPITDDDLLLPASASANQTFTSNHMDPVVKPPVEQVPKEIPSKYVSALPPGIKPNKVQEEIISLPEPEEVSPDPPFEIIADPPRPIGGYEAFNAFIKAHLKYPSKARRNAIQGKVLIEFVVNKNGGLTQFKIIRSIDESCDREALRVLKKHPRWIPGHQRGRPVQVKMVIPISFKLH